MAAEQLRRGGRANRWFVPPEFGGVAPVAGRSVSDAVAFGVGLPTTAFCLTQPTGMAARVAASDNDELKRRVLPGCSTAGRTAPVGIRSLRRARRVQPVMRARETDAAMCSTA
jgi:hypothetical protein